MKRVIIILILLTNYCSIRAMKQQFDMFYREKIKKTKTTTPSYCPCTVQHYMIYNSPEIIHLLNVLYLPKTKESKESIKLGQLIDKYVAKQEIINAQYKKKIETLIKAVCAQVRS